jgi:Chlorophyll A-B binding protein
LYPIWPVTSYHHNLIPFRKALIRQHYSNMKLASAILFASLATSTAFTSVPTVSQPKSVALRMQDTEAAPAAGSSEADMESIPTPTFQPTKSLPKMSESLPFMLRPEALDGSMAGDVGFDPFGFAKTKDDLMYYREAEIKHARLAMLVRTACLRSFSLLELYLTFELLDRDCRRPPQDGPYRSYSIAKLPIL